MIPHTQALSEDELDAAFEVYREALFADISQVFGWDEAFQRQRFATTYLPVGLHWVVQDGMRQALLCVREAPASFHVHLILVLSAFQGQGLGRRLMAEIQQAAARQGKPVTLSAFRNNPRSLAFYRGLGYLVTAEEADFVDFASPPPVSI
ncbi:MAG: GNAT family N-acetyltransferase [Candidatus Sericytochromatia bacterium]